MLILLQSGTTSRRVNDDCLHIELLEEKEIGFVYSGRRAKAFLDALNSAHVVDVGVRTYDLRSRQAVFFKTFEDLFRIITRINDDGLARFFIAEDRAVALQKSDGKCLDNHAVFMVIFISPLAPP